MLIKFSQKKNISFLCKMAQTAVKELLVSKRFRTNDLLICFVSVKKLRNPNLGSRVSNMTVAKKGREVKVIQATSERSQLPDWLLVPLAVS